MADILDLINEKAEKAKASTALRRLATALRPIEELGLEVVLTEGKYPGISIKGEGWKKELSRIIDGEEQNTFSFSQTAKTETGRRNQPRKRIIEIVSNAAARFVVSQ